MRKALSRRDFLKNAGRVGAGAASVLSAGSVLDVPLIGTRIFAQTKEETPAPASPRVVRVISEKWQTEDKKVNDAVVKRMIHESVRQLTGKTDVSAAWKSLFSSGEKVGVKFNNVSRDYCRTNMPVMQAVLEGLKEAGVPREQITFLEQGAVPFTGGLQPDLTPKTEVEFGHGKTRLTPFLTDQVDCLICVPDLKHHHRTGVTGALKNFSHSKSFMDNPSEFHSNNCDPYVAELCALPHFRKKRRLNICCGFKVIFEDGPVPRPRHIEDYHGVLASIDPVAMDQICYEVVKDIRKKKGLSNRVFDTMVRHIATAEKMELGIADSSKIDLVEVPLA
ncbi:MAG TPA: DUF362 domain-containing protein [Candidatus Brocadiia bacterium]|nr:DUF362 domain-containing protein [Candidatus Brocadiia bacterium]